MKKIFVYIVLVIAFTAGVSQLRAQEKLQMKIGYNTGMPIGDFKNFMGKNSFRGFLGELNYPINNRLKVGLGVSFNDYYEKIPRQVYETKDGTISAVVSNSIQTTPIQLKAYYDLTTGYIRPYAGLGLGGNFIGYAQYFGEFGDKSYSFKPSATLDAGVNIPFNKETRAAGVNLGGHFNYLPYNKNGLNNLNNWGLHAAVFFTLR